MRRLAVFLLAAVAGLSAQEKPFLETFFEKPAGPRIQSEAVTSGHLSRPATPAHLPAVLLLPDRAQPAERSRRWTGELAGVGFAALAADHDADQAAQWLATQPFVDPQRLAAIAWPSTSGVAMGLARSRKFAALVLWDTRDAPAGTAVPVLAIPPGTDPDRAWIQVYEFLGQHVEDASAQVARIVDIMRVINSNDGIRGQLAQSLLQPPATAQQWDQVRSRAAIVAEAGNLLASRHPLKGSPEGWKQRANEYRDAATALLKAIEAHNYPAVQHSLQELTQTCARCHADYR